MYIQEAQGGYSLCIIKWRRRGAKLSEAVGDFNRVYMVIFSQGREESIKQGEATGWRDTGVLYVNGICGQDGPSPTVATKLC